LPVVANLKLGASLLDPQTLRQPIVGSLLKRRDDALRAEQAFGRRR
jgi:hypothetical protein